MIDAKFADSRIKAVKKKCFSRGQWKFDNYEDGLILYGVMTKDEFHRKRCALGSISLDKRSLCLACKMCRNLDRDLTLDCN